MDLKRYEILKKVVDAVKITNPDEIRIDDYSSHFVVEFKFISGKEDKKNG